MNKLNGRKSGSVSRSVLYLYKINKIAAIQLAVSVYERASIV